MKKSKELQAISNAIEKWSLKHKINVMFYGEFIAFKGKDFKIVDDMILAYGPEELIKIGMTELSKEIKKDKNKNGFVNF